MHSLSAPNVYDTSRAHSRRLEPNQQARGIRGWLAGKYNRLRRAISPARVAKTAFRELQEVRDFAATPGDIDEHLELMFMEATLHRPKLIVELGVRGGVSTFCFERAARFSDAWLISVDIEDCSHISSYPKWHFVQADDIDFANDFTAYCVARGIHPSIDLLFIDTSHYYEHTVQEIRSWFPLLSRHAKVMFHDTNLKLIGPRKDGCFQLSWNNERGVARALESCFNLSFDSGRAFVTYSRGWMIRHLPNCNGLTIVDRIGVS
jgi:predicted O-methyltransferase YrrM